MIRKFCIYNQLVDCKYKHLLSQMRENPFISEKNVLTEKNSINLQTFLLWCKTVDHCAAKPCLNKDYKDNYFSRLTFFNKKLINILLMAISEKPDFKKVNKSKVKGLKMYLILFSAAFFLLAVLSSWCT